MDQTLIKVETKEELKSLYLGPVLSKVLEEPTPTEAIKGRKGAGGRFFKYVKGSYFIQRFNESFGFLWDMDVTEVIRDGDHLVSKVVVTANIPGMTIEEVKPDGTRRIVRIDPVQIRKTQFGGSEVKRYDKATGKYKQGDMLDLANDYKAATTDGMKKCGMQFGIALDVYSIEEDKENDKSPASQDLVTAVYIRGEKVGLTETQVDEKATEKYKKTADQLTKEEATELIAEFQKLAVEKNGT